jgi:hypothetical protein
LIARIINSKKWSVLPAIPQKVEYFQKKATKKAFVGFQYATEFKWSAGPRRSDGWPGGRLV